MTKPRMATATTRMPTTTNHIALFLPGASMTGLVCARRASSSASADAAERLPVDSLRPKPLIPEIDDGVFMLPVLRTLGSDGIDGSEPAPEPVPGPVVPVLPPGLVLPDERGRILRSPSVGVNSLMTLS